MRKREEIYLHDQYYSMDCKGKKIGRMVQDMWAYRDSATFGAGKNQSLRLKLQLLFVPPGQLSAALDFFRYKITTRTNTNWQNPERLPLIWLFYEDNPVVLTHMWICFTPIIQIKSNYCLKWATICMNEDDSIWQLSSKSNEFSSMPTSAN